MRKPTISEIKQDTVRNSPYFFDRDSMKFFGQRMSDFHVEQSPKGKIFIWAKSKSDAHYTFRQYMPGKKQGYGDLKLVPGNQNTMQEIKEYIKSH